MQKGTVIGTRLYPNYGSLAEKEGLRPRGLHILRFRQA